MHCQDADRKRIDVRVIEKKMNFYTIDPGYDAEAIEADEWTNQAPEPKIMEWKVQPF